MRIVILLFFLALNFKLSAQEAAPFKLGVLRYNGGGDWYANPTSVPNLSKFCNETLDMRIGEPEYVDVGSNDLFQFPFVHMTGHGNVIFSPDEAENLRQYLLAGGFLHIDDNYGLDKFVRLEMKKVFPELEWVEVPFEHAIYSKPYRFSAGLPKIHEHDNKPPQGFALLWQGRMVCFYSYESDLGDGWEDPQVHNDSPETHRKALEMGANLVYYAFSRRE